MICFLHVSSKTNGYDDLFTFENKTSLLLHCAGRNILRIYNACESDTNPQTVLKKLDDYFTGKINETMERFNFNKRNQAMDENV